MATIERTPTGAGLTCLVCHSPNDIDLDHVVNRGMGGSKERDVPENKVPLCRGHHLAKTVGTIKTRVKDGVYYWHKRDSDLVFRVPVQLSERYGCLVACDGAEQSNVDELPGQQRSALSQGAGDGPASTDVGAQPSPALAGPVLTISDDTRGTPGPLMDGEGRRSVPAGVSTLPMATPSPFSLDSDWTALDDDTLQSLYDEGEQRQQEGYLLKCKAVWTYRARHVQTWGESWTDQAIERFGCSRPYAKAYANLWEIWLKSEPYLRTGLASLTDSRSLMQTIGRATVEDGARLLESAVAHVAEYAQPPSVRALVGAETLERERHDCPTCGFTHWVVESDWKQ